MDVTICAPKIWTAWQRWFSKYKVDQNSVKLASSSFISASAKHHANQWGFFYREKLCTARTKLSQDDSPSVRPSVRLSVYLRRFDRSSYAGILSKRLTKHVVRLSSLSDSHRPTILVFLYQTVWQHSDMSLLKGAWNAGDMKNCFLWPLSCFISEMIPDTYHYNEILIGTYTQPTTECHF